jgi:hypothetical protein
MLASIVNRLSETLIASRVQVAEDLDAVVAGTAPDSGDVFVIPFREKAGPNLRATGGFLQEVEVQFLTAFVVRYHSDANGSERAITFDALKGGIEGAVAGWEPGDDFDPCALIAAEASSLGDGASIYVQTWQTARLLQGV